MEDKEIEFFKTNQKAHWYIRNCTRQELALKCAELEQQLQAKDKALDKACKTLTEKNYSCPYEVYNIEPRGDCRKYCKGGMESKCWKEWCENE